MPSSPRLLEGRDQHDGAIAEIASTQATRDRERVGPYEVGPSVQLEIRGRQAAEPVREVVRQVAGQPASDADADRLLASLPPLPEDRGVAASFAKRAATLPPPTAVKETLAAFPVQSSLDQSSSATAQPKAAPLEVLRITPAGDTGFAPELSVTFNQPMIALGSHADSVASGVPIKLTPQPPGRFRWVGTRTLLFTPERRFPMASEYRIEVPKGTRAADGAELARAVVQTFRTSGPSLVSMQVDQQGEITGLSPVVVARFDQAIDARKLIAQTRFCVRQDCRPARAATATEVEQAVSARDVQQHAEAGAVSDRCVAMVPADELPPNVAYEVRLGLVPSAEGPGVSATRISRTLRTRGPLRVTGSECGDGKSCPPGSVLQVLVSNPVDEGSLDLSAFRVQPEARLLSVTRGWSHGAWTLALSVDTRAGTRYTVTVPASVRDEFGQVLGKAKEVAFNVGDASPSFDELAGLTVLDPRGPRALSVRTRGIGQLRARVFAVQPQDFRAYNRALGPPQLYGLPYGRRVVPTRLPGKLVSDTVVSVSDPLEFKATSIDLSHALHGGFGHAVVLVEPLQWPDEFKPHVLTWVQSTQLGLETFMDGEHAYAWVTELADGKPAANVRVSLMLGDRSGQTDGRGVVRLALPEVALAGLQMVVAKRGDDVAFYPERVHGDHSSNEPASDWVVRRPDAGLSWFTFDDRGLYRPGETVHVKGFLRHRPQGPAGRLAIPDVKSVRYEVRSQRGQVLTQGHAVLSLAGGFDLQFSLPANVDLGSMTTLLSTLETGRYEASHSIRVEEFRRPEYEVSLATEGALHILGAPVALQVKAKYYTGGPLVGTPVQVNVSASRAHFDPPNRGNYTFGEQNLWWRDVSPGSRVDDATEPKRWQAHTDSTGTLAFEVLPGSAQPAYPQLLSIHASVQDVSRQRWSDRQEVLVHPGRAYLGMKSERWLVAEHEDLHVDMIVVDLDGNEVPGRKVEVRASRHEAQTSRRETQEREVDVQTCAYTSNGQPHRCTFKPDHAGSYQVVARVFDEQDRPNETRMQAWVTGPSTAGADRVATDRLELIPDRAEYEPGSTARVTLQAPFFPAEAVVLIWRGRVREVRTVHLDGPTAELAIPIQNGDAPTLRLSVALAGDRPLARAPQRRIPAFAVGEVGLKLALTEQRLQVAVTPRDSLAAPGGQAQIDVLVKDSSGRPVPRAEVTLMVVDEAVLALTKYEPGDPLATFYPEIWNGMWSLFSRPLVRIEDQQPLALGPSRGSVGEGGSLAMAEMRTGRTKIEGPPQIRSNFSPIAHFEPALLTDAQGRAQVTFRLPDDLTRYRIFAIAADAPERFGRGESTLIARKPLMVRPSAPRFLNFGDQFELPILVENAGDHSVRVLLGARAANLAFTAGRARYVEVPAHDRVELRLPAATRHAGSALIQVAVQSESGSDAAQVSLPVWTPASDEAFATYGSLIDEAAIAQPVRMPKDVWTEFGGLELSSSSTQLAALTDSLLYVYNYPFECSEQLASRVISVLVLRDVLDALKAKDVPDAEQAKRAVDAGVQALLAMQNPDGSFPSWRRGERPSAYNTVHALHALVRARSAGLPELDTAIARALSGANSSLQEFAGADNQDVWRGLRAYLVYVEGMLKPQHDNVVQLFKRFRPEQFSVESLGFLLGGLARHDREDALVKRILGVLQNRATETASTAQFTDRITDTNHVLLHSDQRSDAIALEGMLAAVPDHDLVPKLAKGLLAHRRSGRWANTQENVFCAIALRSYFDHHEKETPNFQGRMFLGGLLAQAADYRGRSTKQETTLVPMAWLAEQQSMDLVLQKSGQGRMYYRLGLRYAPKSLQLEPQDQGFSVERSYEAVDHIDDVQVRSDGTIEVKAGARVRVTLSMIAKARRYHVALVDSLPAGFEPINPGLAVSEPDAKPPVNPTCRYCRFWWTWYEHDNLRDERVEAFTSLLPAGGYTYSYVARATTPGAFVVPPAKAEEMYMPETFGRSGTARVVVR